jgi:hypothetical protein
VATVAALLLSTLLVAVVASGQAVEDGDVKWAAQSAMAPSLAHLGRTLLGENTLVLARLQPYVDVGDKTTTNSTIVGGTAAKGQAAVT